MPELDRQGLEQAFDIPQELEIVDESTTTSVDNPSGSEVEIIEEGFDLSSDEEAEKIIKDNIDRANDLLDKVQEEITTGNFSARVVEVAGQLINSVTQAAKELLSNSMNRRHLLLKDRVLMLKRRELDIRELGADKPKNQNLIIASREDVLRLLKDPGEKEK